jgi:hypothetical protein
MTITYKGSRMKLVLKLLMGLFCAAPTYIKTETKAVDTAVVATVAVAVDPETQAVEIFEKNITAGANALKKAFEKAQLFQFATLIEKLQNPPTRLQAAKSIPAKYPKLAAALKKAFGDGMASLPKVLAFLKK